MARNGDPKHPKWEQNLRFTCLSLGTVCTCIFWYQNPYPACQGRPLPRNDIQDKEMYMYMINWGHVKSLKLHEYATLCLHVLCS